MLVGGKDTNKIFAKALGVLPDNNVKLFIGVEGAHDITFLINISNILIRDGVNVLNLQKMELDGEVIFFPLGGSTLAIWTSRLEKLDRPEFHLFDRDTAPPAHPKYKKEMDEINKRKLCKARCTAKREMENYLHKDAIVAAYAESGTHISLPANFADFDDVPVKVAEIVHTASGSPKLWAALDDEKRGEKESKVKRVLNSVAAAKMTKAMLDAVDPAGDLLGWFADMKKLLEAGSNM